MRLHKRKATEILQLGERDGSGIEMVNRKKHCTAIVLAAGSGKRMKSATAKQFMMLKVLIMQ